ncbi:hypothetical protein [Kamptonema formosum]|uniref:hypothetical protein n=1 Tax=Kamptonema formosum TaxID=331992 RepID=UPI0012DE2CC3|nr:hypothetical protein [Oscillatoria sp. PCC 10802]
MDWQLELGKAEPQLEPLVEPLVEPVMQPVMQPVMEDLALPAVERQMVLGMPESFWTIYQNFSEGRK